MSPIVVVPSTRSSETTVDEDELCPICLEPLGTEHVIERGCGHRFHDACTEKWIVRSFANPCPTCRAIDWHLTVLWGYMRVLSMDVSDGDGSGMRRERLREFLEIVMDVVDRNDERDDAAEGLLNFIHCGVLLARETGGETTRELCYDMTCMAVWDSAEILTTVCVDVRRLILPRRDNKIFFRNCFLIF